MAELNTDVRFVRGVGEARAKSLAKLGITDLKSLISYFLLLTQLLVQSTNSLIK